MTFNKDQLLASLNPARTRLSEIDQKILTLQSELDEAQERFNKALTSLIDERTLIVNSLDELSSAATELATQCEKYPERLITILVKPIEELNIRTKFINSLKRRGNISWILDLAKCTEEELLKIRYLGRKAVDEIKEALEHQGLSLGMNLAHLPRPCWGIIQPKTNR